MLKLFHRLDLRIAFIGVVALLMAQFGAMAHGYSHDAAANSGSTHQSGAANHDLCNDCLAYAALLSPAGSSATLPAIEPQGRGLAIRAAAASLIPHVLTLAFRSRAPPAIH